MNEEGALIFFIMVHYVNRVDKRGGGVAVDRDLKCRASEQMTTVMDDLTERIRVDTEVEK